MNVVVTGGYGYIGGPLVQRLLEAGAGVTVLARQAPAYLAGLLDGAAFHAWDVRVPWAGPKLPPADVLVHLAAANDVDCQDPLAAFAVNVTGTRNVLGLCRQSGIRRVLYISTWHVFGALEGALDADRPPEPVSDYGLTHWLAEECVRAFARSGAGAGLVVRPTNLYGAPLHRAVDRWTLVPNCFCQEALATGGITLRSSGRQERDFVSLPSLVSQLARLVGSFDEHQGATYTIGAGRGMTIREMATLVAARYQARTGRSCALRFLSDEPKESVPLHLTSARSTAAGLLPAPEGDLAREIDAIFALLEKDG